MAVRPAADIATCAGPSMAQRTKSLTSAAVRSGCPSQGACPAVSISKRAPGIEAAAVRARFGEDLIVVVNDPLAFARWHLGHLDWAAALRSGGITVTGSRDLRKALPIWNRRPEVGARLHAAYREAALTSR